MSSTQIVEPARSEPELLSTSLSSREDSDEQLLVRYQGGDLRAREELVRRFLPVTRRLAGRYRHTGESQDDLEQVAALGLIKAIDRYDPDVGAFVRYAIPNMMGELKRHFRDKGWGMRVPRSMQERSLAVSNAIEELSGELGRSPAPRDVAEHTGLALEEVLEALETTAAYAPAPLDAPYHGDQDGDRTLGDSLGAEDPGYGLVELSQAVSPAFRALPAREQAILKLRFIDDLTQQEIADQVGISQMHVSRLLSRSLDRLAAAAQGQREFHTA